MVEYAVIIQLNLTTTMILSEVLLSNWYEILIYNVRFGNLSSSDIGATSSAGFLIKGHRFRIT